MKNTNSSTRHQSQFVSPPLNRWDAVLEFLSRPLFRKELDGEVHISRKKGKDWTVEVNLSEKQPIKLTTRSRGVGLHDLNW